MLEIDQLILEAQNKFASMSAPKMPSYTAAIKEHLSKFVADVSKDPRCSGLLMQLSICQPHGSSDYVISMHIANSENDSQSALDALTRKPVSTE